ncbi:hypothetical protein DAPPUDRAFT_266093 [Daphnia pulex]|uniref:Uncharacterized protein n=1 Tax=Daphnia pulex TaxID=6669 RepID=E9HUH0_DAPPU|nr:hypothetical protein DAPPUDRAFT_266093 [Daphnia pulex]|eukprot:EFX64612.1 hypothetical protein DAPPUDRAFT_266093 [Daphnia pulex]
MAGSTEENRKSLKVVQQRDVPGIDAAYLAMDTEEGVEVVWNEVRFSERKNFKAQEEKISGPGTGISCKDSVYREL